MRTGAPCLILATLSLAGCSDAPPSWDKLLASRIAAQYPNYIVAPAQEGLRVTRPGRTEMTIDVQPIARFCQRGPRDCEYAIDRMLLELAPKN